MITAHNCTSRELASHFHFFSFSSLILSSEVHNLINLSINRLSMFPNGSSEFFGNSWDGFQGTIMRISDGCLNKKQIGNSCFGLRSLFHNWSLAHIHRLHIELSMIRTGNKFIQILYMTQSGRRLWWLWCSDDVYLAASLLFPRAQAANSSLVGIRRSSSDVLLLLLSWSI